MAYALPVSDKSVTKHIDNHVNPDAEFLALCGECTKDVVDFMHEVTPYSVASTIKGGSLGKGTAVKGASDLDILFVVNDVKSVAELKKKIKQIKHDIHTAICCNSFGTQKLTAEQKAIRRQRKKNKPFAVSNIRRTPFTVSFTMTKPDGRSLDVDVLIVPNISTTEPAGKFSKDDLTKIYQMMKDNPSQRDYYAKCLAPIQVDYVKSQPEKIKRSIRLMKSWVKENEVPRNREPRSINWNSNFKVLMDAVEEYARKWIKREQEGIDFLSECLKHKLPSYAVELLVIKVYEDYNRLELGGITEEKLVRGAFELLKDPNNLRIEFDKHYDLNDFGRPDGPYIMDPANPYHNLFRPKTVEYWRNYNKTDNVVVCDPDIQRLQNDARVALESL